MEIDVLPLGVLSIYIFNLYNFKVRVNAANELFPPAARAAGAAWTKHCYKLHFIFVALPKSYLLNGEDTLNRNHNSER